MYVHMYMPITIILDYQRKICYWKSTLHIEETLNFDFDILCHMTTTVGALSHMHSQCHKCKHNLHPLHRFHLPLFYCS